MSVVFFDIGDTLATPIFAKDSGRLSGFNVIPEALKALQALQQRAQRMGIISNAGDEQPAHVNELLDGCGLLGFFDSQIIIYGEKSSSEIFKKAAARAGVQPSQCIFVGENKGERGHAAEAGFRVVAAPSLVLSALDATH